METAEMRRSTLQRKDREELTLIATTLGIEPSSRARKGEIIDLILGLVAGGDDSSMSTTPGDAKAVDAANADKPPEAATGKPKAAGSAHPGGNPDRSPEGSGDQPSGEPRKRRRRGRDRENNKDSNDTWEGEPIPVAGHLELRPEGYGFLRVDGALPSKDDAYVPVRMVRQFHLRKGDHLTGTSRPANRTEKNPAMVEIRSVNDGAPEVVGERIAFEALPAVHPSEPIVLARGHDRGDPTCRVIDLVTPVGKGQRALLAGPPRSGRTSVLQQVIRAMETDHDDLELFVLLLDERPEDITEMTRWVEKGEVVALPFDRPADEQVTIAEMVIERAKRRVESGNDVVVIVDGVTRLARAYAQEASGGRPGVSVDAMTVHPAKRFLGAARKLEGGGSLTMLATITVDTDSTVDATIYEELAPTANLELRLSRAAAVRRVFPAVDIEASATVHEESLRDDDELREVRGLRRGLAAITADPETDEVADLQALLARIADTVSPP